MYVCMYVLMYVCKYVNIYKYITIYVHTYADNFNVEVEQNRTAQKYNVMGSYLLIVYDDQSKLFTTNGKIATKFQAWIKDIVKASSPPVSCLSLAVTRYKV